MRGTDPFEMTMAERFRAFVDAEAYPCVGAKSALGQDQLDLFVGRRLDSCEDDRRLLLRLYGFIESYRREPTLFSSFVAVFKGPRGLSEQRFEALLWARLFCLHQLDRERYGWDPRVSDDPGSPRFSFSLHEEACFVIGLHDGSSRQARRFERPALVFNLHSQFEALREDGRFESLRDSIRERDRALQGSINPMAAGFGETSEARQYSGRAVKEDWRCPFHTGGREDAA